MSFQYLDQIVATSNAGDLIELFNLGFGAGKETSNAFEALKRLSASKPMGRCLSILQRDAASNDLIERRELVSPYCQEELLTLPKGTLGRVFAEVCKVMDYDINFYPSPQYFNNLETAADYVNYRVLATHDIQHIVTGFALNGAGETGVISLSVQQFAFPGYAFIDITLLLGSWLTAERPYRDIEDELEKTRTARYKLQSILKGMAMGEEAKPLFPVDWHSLMHKDLDDVRQELGIKPVTDGLISWYSNADIVTALN